METPLDIVQDGEHHGGQPPHPPTRGPTILQDSSLSCGEQVARYSGLMETGRGLMVPLLYSKQARFKEDEKLLQARLCCAPNKLQAIK